MSKRRFKFRRVKLKTNGTEVNINLKRFERQFANAQYYFDRQVMHGMLPYMPMQTGTFINRTSTKSDSLAGSGIVIAAARPYGAYLYEGKVMVDRETGRGPMKIRDKYGGYVLRFRKGAELIATDRPLTYGNPKATPHWFETAKRNHGKQWIEGAKRIAGGG